MRAGGGESLVPGVQARDCLSPTIPGPDSPQEADSAMLQCWIQKEFHQFHTHKVLPPPATTSQKREKERQHSPCPNDYSLDLQPGLRVPHRDSTWPGRCIGSAHSLLPAAASHGTKTGTSGPAVPVTAAQKWTGLPEH